MRERKKAFWRVLKKLHSPPNWVAWITIATTLVVCPLLVATIVLDFFQNMYAVVAGLLCAVLVVYTVGVCIVAFLNFRKKVLKAADRYEFTRHLRENYEFRTMFFGACAFLCNVGYTLFLLFTAFRYRSVWYGMIGIYYILLSVARGGVIIQSRKDERKYKYDFHRLQSAKVGTYRYCAIMMLALSFSLGLSVAELVVDSSGFRHAKWLIFVFSGMAAYKVIMGIVHFVRSTKRDDLVIRALRYINFAVTLMSVLCVQTSVLWASPLTETVDVLNGITGALVCLITLGIGVYMMFFASRAKKKLLGLEVTMAENVEQTSGYNRADYGEEYK